MQMQAMQMLNPLANPLVNPMAFNNNMMYNPMQPGLQNQQMNLLPPMMNPSLNMMNLQSNLSQSQALNSSRASTNNQKILNES